MVTWYGIDSFVIDYYCYCYDLDWIVAIVWLSTAIIGALIFIATLFIGVMIASIVATYCSCCYCSCHC